jgi:hypothetical protein
LRFACLINPATSLGRTPTEPTGRSVRSPPLADIQLVRLRSTW